MGSVAVLSPPLGEEGEELVRPWPPRSWPLHRPWDEVLVRLRDAVVGVVLLVLRILLLYGRCTDREVLFGNVGDSKVRCVLGLRCL